MCVIVQNKYVPLMSLRPCRAVELYLNMLKDNIEMDIKEMVIIITRTENIFINTYSQYLHFRSR
jgi:hypothetical protein